MNLGTRRVFRLSFNISLALVAGYSMALSFPFMAPLFAFMLAAQPKPPPGVKGLIGLPLAVALCLGIGILITPLLSHYPFVGLLLVLLGLFLANYLTLNMGKGPVGALLTMGLTMITMVGQLGHSLAVLLIQELMIAIAIAIVCQWIVYPFFPEPDEPAPQPPPPEPVESRWQSARATLIVFPAYLLGLTNPTFYMPIIMKSVTLGQQTELTSVKGAGAELLGSTFMAGALAIVFWMCLKITPNLWMFFLWMLIFSVFIVSRLYGVVASRYPPTYWQNVMVTLLIFIGPAVADSANGKDPATAFAVRFGLFIFVALYAWVAMLFLEYLRQRQYQKNHARRLKHA
ncbi:hypothetical protein GCM10007052_05370 [Halioglobus japonicus]|uniref:DUF2955 domain-containing protein n=2 Tax=Halioglobus japonicus TaxID=930805 RepID=A0AAP8MH78_9GAMM|nr:DUF2955 domain-containing protein [Halioglobus japonicus]PLW87442.1 hypothetical protein C0029_02300 [Halioglobus japonicus]GHD08449.1 hypothetical protein GCM10007052_05370 [Halioglobus japonicus]